MPLHSFQVWVSIKLLNQSLLWCMERNVRWGVRKPWEDNFFASHIFTSRLKCHSNIAVTINTRAGRSKYTPIGIPIHGLPSNIVALIDRLANFPRQLSWAESTRHGRHGTVWTRPCSRQRPSVDPCRWMSVHNTSSQWGTETSERAALMSQSPSEALHLTDYFLLKILTMFYFSIPVDIQYYMSFRRAPQRLEII